MEKHGLKIVNLIHDITQLGYEVKFCSDFTDMTRLEFTEEFNVDFYEHRHLGYPNGGTDKLEKAIISTLAGFLEEHRGSEDA